MIEDTFEKVKKGIKETAEGVKETAEEVIDPETYTGSDEGRKNREYDEAGGKQPMNPDDIAEHEPTAVKRDNKQESSGDPV